MAIQVNVLRLTVSFTTAWQLPHFSPFKRYVICPTGVPLFTGASSFPVLLSFLLPHHHLRPESYPDFLFL